MPAESRFLDRFRRGTQRNAERPQQRTQREMVVIVACEARQVEHDHEMDTALVQAANVSFCRWLRSVAFALSPSPNGQFALDPRVATD
jgi:hypothetical protein